MSTGSAEHGASTWTWEGAPVRPEGGTQETPGRVQPHSLLRESVTSEDLHRPEPCFTGRSLSPGVELLAVLDVPSVLDGDDTSLTYL